MIVASAPAKAALYACRNWHYSGTVPAGKLIRYGCWDEGSFWGVIIFGRGASPQIGRPYDLRQYQIVELNRIALKDGHPFPVSQAMAVALRFLRKGNPGLRLVVSYADTTQGHHGGIYQAANWVYTGATEGYQFRINGQIIHSKSMHARYGSHGVNLPWLRANLDPKAERLNAKLHKYVYPLDPDMRKRVEALRCSHPAPIVQGQDVPRPGVHGGSTPTSALS